MRLVAVGTLISTLAIGVAVASDASARASFTRIGMLEGTDFRASVAYAVSADGTTVVGDATNGIAAVAFRWTAAEGALPVGDLPVGNPDPRTPSDGSRARGVSADGSVIVGWTTSTELVTEALDSWVWVICRAAISKAALSAFRPMAASLWEAAARVRAPPPMKRTGGHTPAEWFPSASFRSSIEVVRTQCPPTGS